MSTRMVVAVEEEAITGVVADYLVMEYISRDALAPLFWSELDYSRTRADLRHGLATLKKTLVWASRQYLHSLYGCRLSRAGAGAVGCLSTVNVRDDLWTY